MPEKMISMADAVYLRSFIQKKIAERIAARTEAATITFAKGETPEIPETDFATWSERVQQARTDFRALDVAMARANLENTVNWDDRMIPLMEALQLAKDLRAQVNELKKFGAQRKTERAGSGSLFSRVERGSVDLITQTTYDPADMTRLAEKLERQVNRLSRDIDRKNEAIQIPFASASAYMA